MLPVPWALTPMKPRRMRSLGAAWAQARRPGTVRAAAPRPAVVGPVSAASAMDSHAPSHFSTKSNYFPTTS